MKTLGRALLLYGIVVLVLLAALVTLSSLIDMLLGPGQPEAIFVPWLVVVALIPFVRPLERRVRRSVDRLLPG